MASSAPGGSRNTTTSSSTRSSSPMWFSWLRQRRAVRTSASAERVGHSTDGPRHLVVLVNGLWGAASNWDVLSQELRSALPPGSALVHASQANSRFATYNGIDACGARLASEVQRLVDAQPNLTRLSFVAHSMGGLIARYAAGQLFDPTTGRMAGRLLPAHFVTLASPHCGCDTDGVAGVPFIGWSESLPLLGQPLFRLLADISGATAALLLQRTGQQFFALDGGLGQPPLLLRMTQDCPEAGLHCFSALAAFGTRTLYANLDGDHLVGHANASLRSLEALPPPPLSAASAKGCVYEDSLSAGFYPDAWRTLQQQWAARARGNGDDSAAARAVRQPYAPSRLHDAVTGWHELAGNSSGTTPAALPANQLQQQQQLMQQRGAHQPSAAEAAAEADLSRGLAAAAGEAVAVAANASAAVADVSADAATAAAGSRAAVVSKMLRRLQELPWRRIDVSFQGARFGLAHNNIQVTRWWWNWEGAAVAAHVAQQLALMDELVCSDGSDAPVAAPEASPMMPAV